MMTNRMMKIWLKRILLVFLVLGFIGMTALGGFIAGFSSALFSKSDSTAMTEEVIAGEDELAKIGILSLEGLIVTSEGESPFPTGEGMITSSQVKRWLREISQDSDLKALVIEINSPGGSPVAADEIYQAIKTLRATGRSVVVVMEDTATSGAYFIACAADTIVANPATLTGSIGVIAELTNAQELLSKLGIDIEVYKSGKYKDFSSFSRQRTEEEKALIQDYIDTAFNLFVSRVAEGRNMDEAAVRALAEGQVFSGEKALELGLIDQLGSIEDGVSAAQKLQGLESAKIVRYRTESALDLLLGRVSAVMNPFDATLNYLSAPGLRASYLPSF